jgi:hypothetical protein
MKKWKWLFVISNATACLIFTMVEFLKSYQEGTNASMCSGIMLKNNDTSVE